MRIVVWNITELKEMFDSRRKNQFDCNILVTGGTGKGKSSLILKLLSRFDGFHPKKHLVYSKEDTIRLLREQKFSFCWNDELIEAGFKREHWNTLQIELIKTLTQYRCNWNIFCGALPVFFTLDKELRKLFAINIEVIRRGEAVIHIRKEGRRYSDDPWDAKHNSKIEEQWSKNMQRNPNFKIPYHKYSTFAGYLYWNDITEKQRQLYEEVRDAKKRQLADDKQTDEVKQKPFYDQLFTMMKNKELDDKTLESICKINNKQIVAVRTKLNQMLRNEGGKDRVKDLLLTPPNFKNTNKDLLDELDNIDDI